MFNVCPKSRQRYEKKLLFTFMRSSKYLNLIGVDKVCLIWFLKIYVLRHCIIKYVYTNVTLTCYFVKYDISSIYISIS